MNISASVDSLSFTAKLDGLSVGAAPAVKRGIDKSTIDLASYIQRNKLSGQVLNQRSQDLVRSVKPVLAQETATGVVEGAVTIGGGGVKYAAIHEFGGVTPPHVIVPVKASVLAFEIGGKTIFAKKVNHPGSKMPERSYARTSLAENKDAITANIAGAIAQAASGANA